MDFLEGLNPQQRAAVAHVEGPLLILAGAGSGKTRVITHRMAYLIQACRVPGPAILAVTFTNKAADEMRQRVLKLIGEEERRNAPLVSTFHSFCVRVLRRDGDRLADIRPGFTKRFTIYDDTDQVALIKSIYKGLGLNDEFMQYRAMCSWISHNKSRNISPNDAYKSASEQNLMRMAKVYDEYETRLQQANAMDFDDLLLETVRLLRHDNDLRTLYNEQYEFVMIDEYQDTNRSQYELMRLLTQKQQNVAVVGDEDQSIYSWRGADIRNILDFEQDFPNARVIRLEQNYRSTKNILDAASALVSHNTERKGKWLWTESGAGPRVALYVAPTGENEALYIADTIDKTLRRNPEEHVAVLYRTNFQSRQIEEALRRYGRNYIVVGGFSFYQRAEIKDVLAYLRVLSTPHDSVSLLRIINTPARGIGKTTVDQMEQYARERGLSIWDAMARMLEEHELPTRAEAAMRSFREMIERLSAYAAETKSPADILKEVLEQTGYRGMLQADTTPEAETRLENIDELRNAAAEAADRGEELNDFLDHAALVADADSVDERSPVSLLTIHNAKGLEFPVVFIAGMEDGLFPHSRSSESPAALEEERRLCYVAMTRAEKKLYMTRAKLRRRYGGGELQATKASKFLSEIPSKFIEPLSPGAMAGDAGEHDVDLYAERHEVRDVVKRNLYTGKTYNSIENISQYFAERGMKTPSMVPQPPVPKPAAPPAPVPKAPGAQPAPPRAATPAPPIKAPVPVKALPQIGKPLTQSSPAYASKPAFRPPAPRKKPFGAGSTVRHPKYGRGTVLRREGDGEDAKLTVSFPGYGLKKIIEKFAGMEEE